MSTPATEPAGRRHPANAKSHWILGRNSRNAVSSATVLPKPLERLAQISLVLLTLSQYFEHMKFMPFTVTQALGGFLAIAFIVDRGLWRRPDAVLWYLVAFFAVSAFSAVYYLDESLGYRDEALQRIYSLLQFLLLFYFSSCLFVREQTQRWFLYAVFVGAATVAALGLLGVGATERYGRMTFGELDENFMAVLTGLGILTAIHLALHRATSLLLRVVAAVSMLWMAWFLVLTGSRGGMLAIGVGLAVYFVRSKRPIYWGLGACAVALLAWSISFSEVASFRWDLTRYSGDTASRDAIFRQSFELFKERPIIGRGEMNSYAALGFRLDKLQMGHHNELLWVLNSAGLLGGLFVLLAVRRVVIAVWNDPEPLRKHMSAALLAFLGVSAMSIEMHNRKIAWVLLAFLVCPLLRGSVKAKGARVGIIASRR